MGIFQWNSPGEFDWMLGAAIFPGMKPPKRRGGSPRRSSSKTPILWISLHVFSIHSSYALHHVYCLGKHPARCFIYNVFFSAAPYELSFNPKIWVPFRYRVCSFEVSTWYLFGNHVWDTHDLFLLGQWLNFKLFGITYLVGKIKFKLSFQGSIR